MSGLIESMTREANRGHFAYWPEASETAWHAHAPKEWTTPPAPRAKGYTPISVRPNYSHPGNTASDDYASFDASLEAGRSYMVGRDVPMPEYIRTHRSALQGWQPAAFAWAKANPYYKLQFTLGGNEWQVYTRGDHVVFALPYHDAGGERHYITKDGRSKILVNVD